MVLALLWNVPTWLIVLAVWNDVTEGGRKPLLAAVTGRPGVLALLIFVIVGLALLAPAVRGMAQVGLSGRSVFRMAAVPGVVGGSLEGVIAAPGRLHLREDQGIRLHLTCVVTTTQQQWRHGKRVRVTSTSLAWENDRVVGPKELVRSGLETLIPVRMAIPASCRESAEKTETRPGYAWFLEARAEPGHAWRAEFEVPVFRTADSPPEPELPDPRSLSLPEVVRLGQDLVQEQLAAVAEPTPRPATSRIVVHPPSAEGVRIDYPLAPAFLAVSAFWLLTLPLYAVPLSLFPSVPLGPLAPAALTLAGELGPAASWALALVVNGLAGLSTYYWPRRLLIGPRRITLFCGLPFFGARRRLPTAEAERVAADPKHFAIVRAGRTNPLTGTFVVAPPGLYHSEARWLATEIERALGAHR